MRRNFPAAFRLLELRHRVAGLAVAAVATLLQQGAPPLRIHAGVDQERSLAGAAVRRAGVACLGEIDARSQDVVGAREEVAEVRATRRFAELAAAPGQFLRPLALARAQHERREGHAGAGCALVARPLEQGLRADRILRAADPLGEHLAEIPAGARAVRRAHLLEAGKSRPRVRVLTLDEGERPGVVCAAIRILAFTRFAEELRGARLVRSDTEPVAQAGSQLVTRGGVPLRASLVEALRGGGGEEDDRDQRELSHLR